MTPTPPGNIAASGVGVPGMPAGMMPPGVMGTMPRAPFGMAGELRTNYIPINIPTISGGVLDEKWIWHANITYLLHVSIFKECRIGECLV